MSSEKITGRPPDLESVVQNYLKTGSEEAKENVLRVGKVLVNYYAGIYSPGALDENLRQAANEGFQMALKKFDPSREVLFSTYATHCIVSEIRQELRSRKLFKVPDWLQRLQDDVVSATEELSLDRSNLPTLKDIAEKMNIAEKGISEAMQAGSVSYQDIDLSSLKSLRKETFKLPIEDVITLRKSIDRLQVVQRKVLSLISVNLSELNRAMEEEEQALTQAQAGYLRMVDHRIDPPDSDDEADGFRIDFPDQFTEEEVLCYFEVLADEYGLRLVDIRFKGKPKPEDKTNLSVPLEIELEGRYRGLLQLLDHLRNREGSVKVGKVSTTRSENIPARISIYILLKTYYSAEVEGV